MLGSSSATEATTRPSDVPRTTCRPSSSRRGRAHPRAVRHPVRGAVAARRGGPATWRRASCCARRTGSSLPTSCGGWWRIASTSCPTSWSPATSRCWQTPGSGRPPRAVPLGARVAPGKMRAWISTTSCARRDRPGVPRRSRARRGARPHPRPRAVRRQRRQPPAVARHRRARRAPPARPRLEPTDLGHLHRGRARGQAPFAPGWDEPDSAGAAVRRSALLDRIEPCRSCCSCRRGPRFARGHRPGARAPEHRRRRVRAIRSCTTCCSARGQRGSARCSRRSRCAPSPSSGRCWTSPPARRRGNGGHRPPGRPRPSSAVGRSTPSRRSTGSTARRSPDGGACFDASTRELRGVGPSWNSPDCTAARSKSATSTWGAVRRPATRLRPPRLTGSRT